jgi:hypothetical protein
MKPTKELVGKFIVAKIRDKSDIHWSGVVVELSSLEKISMGMGKAFDVIKIGSPINTYNTFTRQFISNINDEVLIYKDDIVKVYDDINGYISDNFDNFL